MRRRVPGTVERALMIGYQRPPHIPAFSLPAEATNLRPRCAAAGNAI